MPIWHKNTSLNRKFNRVIKNEVKVNGEPDYLYENLSRIGYPINQEWGLIAERLFIDISDINNSPEQFNGLSSSSSTYLPLSLIHI